MHNLLRPFLINNSYRLLRDFSHSSSLSVVDMASPTWRGVPLSEIIGSLSPWGAPEFPLVKPSHNHTVLYHIPNDGHTADWRTTPQRGQDKWDNDHVRMPCSNKSLYPVETSDGETHLKKRWEIIEEALRKPILNSQQLADTILSYNTKFKTIWKFRSLHALFNDHLDEDVTNYFFQVTLPQIANLALKLPKIVQAPIPLLKQHKNHSISLTQEQIASLLANAFFCTLPRRNTTKRTSEYAAYPHINFSPLYECSPSEDALEKLTCFCHYFKTVCAKAPRGIVTVSRRSVAPGPKGLSGLKGPKGPNIPDWSASRASIAGLPLHVDPDGKIEDAHGLIQLDFANKYLGGGVLGHGCVQEEIRFAICPELMISMLFTEVLRPNEALFMIGCVRYSDYTGYGRSFRWAGPHSSREASDSSGRARVAVLAIDAAPYSRADIQYRAHMIRRELDKAWVGFSFYTANEALHYPGLATGNWGCGAFGGTPDLKALIQIMAAAEARRPMAYYTFGDIELRDQIIDIYNVLSRHNVTVGQLYNYIIKYCDTGPSRGHLHSYIQQKILDDKPRSPRPSSPERMDTSASPKLLEHHESTIQSELRNASPDLFSQEEDSSQNSDQPTNSGLKPSENKTSENKIQPQTKRLFDELQKFDEDNGKLNLNSSNSAVTSRHFDCPESIEKIVVLKPPNIDFEVNDACKASSSHETPKIATSAKKMATSETKMAASTSRLFDELQKFDDEQGKLKLNVSSVTPITKHTPHDSDASVDSDKSDAPPEVKRKFTRKITDYFSKKT